MKLTFLLYAALFFIIALTRADELTHGEQIAKEIINARAKQVAEKFHVEFSRFVPDQELFFFYASREGIHHSFPVLFTADATDDEISMIIAEGAAVALFYEGGAPQR